LTRKAKRSSAANHDGSGLLGSVFGRRAFATRGASGDAKGSSAPSPRRLALSAALAICAAVALTAAPVQAATRSKITEVCAPEGESAGQCSGPSGIAVNRSGVGGVTPGDFYVADTNNNRISEFSVTGSFVRAWGYDVVAAGQDNTGANEQQKFTVKASGGKFWLGFNGSFTGAQGKGTWNTASPTTITITTHSSFQIGQVVYSNFAGIPAGDEIVSCSPSCGTAANSLTISAPVTANNINRAIFGLDIPYNVSAAALESKLNHLPSIEGVGGSVSVSRTGVQNTPPALSEFEYTVTFNGGTFAGNDVPGLEEVGNTHGLLGAGKAMTPGPTVPGGGFETCKAVSSPADVCKAGTSEALGESTAAGGAVTTPQGVAVDQANGNVYVYDSFSNRIDVFSATGAFEGAFGWEVDKTTPQAELQFCTVASRCQAGAGSESAGGFASGGPSRTLAVDSSGHLYVPDPGNLRLDEFEPLLSGSTVTGAAFVRAIGWKVKVTGAAEELQVCTTATGCQAGTAGNGAGQFSEENPRGVAVDSSGNIYAVNYSGTCAAATPCRVEKFNPSGTITSPNEDFGPASGECQLTYESGEGENEAAIAAAVDPTNQHLLVLKKTAAEEMKVCEFDSAGNEIEIFPTTAMAASSQFLPGLAVGSAERVFATNGGPSVYILGPPPPPPVVEIKPANEITSTSAKLNGKVTVPAPGGPGFDTAYRFEYSADNGLHWIAVPVPDQSLGSTSGSINVSQDIGELQPNLTYRFRLVASDGGGGATSSDEIFTTTGAKPSVLHTIALPVTGTAAKLTAAVNPNNSPTTYHFEWGTTTAYGNQVPDFEAFVGSGGQPVALAAQLSGLQLSTTYHFRLVATNGSGTTFGPDATFTTNFFPTACPNEAIRQGISDQALPDCRAAELVSPPDKRPQGAVEGFILNGEKEVYFQAAADGNSVTFPILSGLGDTGAGGLVHYLAARSGSGWQSSRVSPDSTVPNPGGKVIPSELAYASLDLSCQLIETFNPLTADTPSADVELGVTNLYRRNADRSYTLLSNVLPGNAGLSGQRHFYTVGGTSPDCGRVVFQSNYKLLPGTPSGISGIYEWDHGTLRDAGLLPDGSAVQSTTGMGALEGEGNNGGSSNGFFRHTSSVNAVAPDGRRLFFHATSDEASDSGKPAVFVRKGPEPGETVKASQKQAGGAEENNGAYYQTASPDGSHLFFTANYGLTGTPAAGWPTSCRQRNGSADTQGLNGEGCDLYDYHVETEHLTDLSAVANPADTQGAEVQGVVAVSDNGSYVYFAARGQLVPGQGNTYAQNHSGVGFTNIYLSHNGTLAYVATIKFADLSFKSLAGEGTSSGNLMVQASTRASQTTPDGRHLLFTSKANVTGYPAGEVFQAYLYSAESGTTVCVSCRPDGQPSVGNAWTTPIRTSMTEVEEHYRIPRSLSADGSRVFFSMPDALAPGAVESPWGGVENTSGKTNLYEWEQGQVYFLATFDNKFEGFKDASASGNDVFVQSPARLDPRYDIDTVRDLYDFRVNGGFPAPPPPPVPCDPAADQCQGTPTPAPGASSPASQSFSGAGNPPLQPPRCPKGKVRRKGKCVPCPKGKVRRKGKCVPKNPRHKAAHKRHHNRAANANHGGAK